MAGGIARDDEPEFQVAPMVDVLLTILIFFMMITSAQVLKVDKTIVLPVARHAEKVDSKRNQVIINVRWLATVKKAQYVIDEHVFNSLAEMTEGLKRAKASGAHKVTPENPFAALIRADQEIPAIYVSQTMNACGEVGITNISFSTLNHH